MTKVISPAHVSETEIARTTSLFFVAILFSITKYLHSCTPFLWTTCQLV